MSDAASLAAVALAAPRGQSGASRMMARAEGALAAHERSAAADHRRARALPAAKGDVARMPLARHSAGTGKPRRARLGAVAAGRDLWAHGASASAARVTPYRSRLPVICIGNFTAGGGGKTPTAIAVAEVLQGRGRASLLPHPRLWRQDARPGAGRPRARARRGRRRAAAACRARADRGRRRTAPHGAKFIEGTDATVIVMDDGFQNPQLVKDLSPDRGRCRDRARQRAHHAGWAVAGAARQADAARRCAAPDRRRRQGRAARQELRRRRTSRCSRRAWRREAIRAGSACCR